MCHRDTEAQRRKRWIIYPVPSLSLWHIDFICLIFVSYLRLFQRAEDAVMNNVKPIVVRSAGELASALRLSPADAVEMDIRGQINDKIIEAVKRSGLTHAQVAKTVGTSRSRLTALLNRDRSHVSTDLLLRILVALGYRTKVSFRRIQTAA